MIDKLKDRITVDDNGCWICSGSSMGQMEYAWVRHEKKRLYAHRFSYQHFKGEIPKGMCVLHSCDVPRCVNPEHLFLGTKADNNRDKTSKGRHHYQIKTHCPQGHEYTEENTYRPTPNHRQCRACRKERNK